MKSTLPTEPGMLSLIEPIAMNLLSRIICALSAPLFLTACQSNPVQEEEVIHFRVGVNAIALADALSMRRFILAPSKKEIAENDLVYQEFSGQVRRVLARAGFVEAKDRENADILIGLSYEIGPPEAHEYSYAIPTFGITGFSEYSDTFYHNGDSSSTFGNISPTFGITGAETRIGHEIKFTRRLAMTALDLRAYERDETVRKVWSVLGVSVGSSGDLRRVFPYILLAVEQYVGRSSGHVQILDVQENDPRVIELLSP